MSAQEATRPSITELTAAVDRSAGEDILKIRAHALNTVLLRGAAVYQRKSVTPADIRDYQEMVAILDRRETSVSGSA